jgi:hypothetical protein
MDHVNPATLTQPLPDYRERRKGNSQIIAPRSPKAHGSAVGFSLAAPHPLRSKSHLERIGGRCVSHITSQNKGELSHVSSTRTALSIGVYDTAKCFRRSDGKH